MPTARRTSPVRLLFAGDVAFVPSSAEPVLVEEFDDDDDPG